jgi:hypothetical protein
VFRLTSIAPWPAGPKHLRWCDALIDGVEERHEETCRCTIGDDHDDSEQLSDDEAEDIWLSRGTDEDYGLR